MVAYTQDSTEQRTLTVDTDEPHELTLQHIGEESDGTPSQIEFASQAEMEAVPATVANKAASPLGVQQSIRARTADSADVDNGAANKLVPADVLALRLHALQSAVNAIDVDSSVEKVARTDVADADVTRQDKEEWQNRVGTDQPVSGTWQPWSSYYERPTGSLAETLSDTGVKVDASATEAQVEYAARVEDLGGDEDAIGTIDAATLDRLRANRATAGLVRSDAGDTVARFELTDANVEVIVGILANGNFGYGSGSIVNDGARFRLREGNVERYYLRGNTEPIPAGKLAKPAVHDAGRDEAGPHRGAGRSTSRRTSPSRTLGTPPLSPDRPTSRPGSPMRRSTHLEAEVAALPSPQSTSTIEDIARETGPRRDAVVTLQAATAACSGASGAAPSSHPSGPTTGGRRPSGRTPSSPSSGRVARGR